MISQYHPRNKKPGILGHITILSLQCLLTICKKKTETLNLNLVVWKYHSTRHSHCFSTLAVDCTFHMSKLIWTSFPLNNKPSINSRQPKMQIYMLVHTAKKCKIMYIKSSYWIWFSQTTETWRKGSFCGRLLGRFPGNRRSARAEFGERGNSVHLDGESIVLTKKKMRKDGSHNMRLQGTRVSIVFTLFSFVVSCSLLLVSSLPWESWHTPLHPIEVTKSEHFLEQTRYLNKCPLLQISIVFHVANALLMAQNAHLSLQLDAFCEMSRLRKLCWEISTWT